MDYPEHDKLGKVKGNSQAIGEFIDWLRFEKHVYLSIYRGSKGDLTHVHVSSQALLADYYGIDLVKLEEEKRDMLRTIQEVGS